MKSLRSISLLAIAAVFALSAHAQTATDKKEVPQEKRSAVSITTGPMLMPTIERPKITGDDKINAGDVKSPDGSTVYMDKNGNYFVNKEGNKQYIK